MKPNKKPTTRLTYRAAGVDIDAGDSLVENIKPFAKRTLRPGVLAGIGWLLDRAFGFSIMPW